MTNQLTSIIDTPVKTYQAPNPNNFRNLMVGAAALAVIATGYGINRIAPDIAETSRNVVGFIVDSFSLPTPEELFGKNSTKVSGLEQTLVNSGAADGVVAPVVPTLEKYGYSICNGEKDLSLGQLKTAMLTYGFDGFIDKVENDIFSGNFDCKINDNSYVEANRMLGDAYNTGTINELEFDKSKLLIKNLNSHFN